ncbi:hypothetical protein [Flavobacterium degerlachei]|jgi:hypothetical protein|uniref:Uncharacterized protein n=1 Tax=Flavobacterium degerlachei TaxID=229203 RepID=A0A1H3D3A4_9FLAO|nr:hypothetical protein [Flavobacterium degerlachei]SDX60234.1 hypothetical protein SAMN05444338_11269 [Flavobacterium degerlachei]
MFFALPRIYLNEITKQINKKDIRTARKWCKGNFLKVYKDSSGEFAYQYEFDLVFNMPLIKDLKLKHGDNWEDFYHAYKKNELHKMIDSTKSVEKTGYVPKGKLSLKLFGGSLK